MVLAGGDVGAAAAGAAQCAATGGAALTLLDQAAAALGGQPGAGAAEARRKTVRSRLLPNPETAPCPALTHPGMACWMPFSTQCGWDDIPPAQQQQRHSAVKARAHTPAACLSRCPTQVAERTARWAALSAEVAEVGNRLVAMGMAADRLVQLQRVQNPEVWTSYCQAKGRLAASAAGAHSCWRCPVCCLARPLRRDALRPAGAPARRRAGRPVCHAPPAGKATEAWLLHGTPAANIPIITRGGLMQDVASAAAAGAPLAFSAGTAHFVGVGAAAAINLQPLRCSIGRALPAATVAAPSRSLICRARCCRWAP